MNNVRQNGKLTAADIFYRCTEWNNQWWARPPTDILAWCGVTPEYSPTHIFDQMDSIEQHVPHKLSSDTASQAQNPDRFKRVAAVLAHDIIAAGYVPTHSEQSAATRRQVIRGKTGVLSREPVECFRNILGQCNAISASAAHISDISVGIGSICPPMYAAHAVTATEMLSVTDPLRADVSVRLEIDTSGLAFSACSLFDYTNMASLAPSSTQAAPTHPIADIATSMLPERLCVCDYATALEALAAKSNKIQDAARQALQSNLLQDASPGDTSNNVDPSGVVGTSAAAPVRNARLWVPELPVPPPLRLVQGTVTRAEVVSFDKNRKTFPSRVFGTATEPAIISGNARGVVFGVPCCCRYTKLCDVAVCAASVASTRCMHRAASKSGGRKCDAFEIETPMDGNKIYGFSATCNESYRAWTCTSANVVCRSTFVSIFSVRPLLMFVREQLRAACVTASELINTVLANALPTIANDEPVNRDGVQCESATEWELYSGLPMIRRDAIVRPMWDMSVDFAATNGVGVIFDASDIYISAIGRRSCARNPVVIAATKSHGGHCRVVPLYVNLVQSVISSIATKFLHNRRCSGGTPTLCNSFSGPLPNILDNDRIVKIIADITAESSSDVAYASTAADQLRQQWLLRAVRSRGIARDIVAHCSTMLSNDVQVVSWNTPHTEIALPYHPVTMQSCTSAGILRQRHDSTYEDANKHVHMAQRLRTAPVSHAPLQVLSSLHANDNGVIQASIPAARGNADSDAWPLWTHFGVMAPGVGPAVKLRAAHPTPVEFALSDGSFASIFNGCAGMLMQQEFDARIGRLHHQDESSGTDGILTPTRSPEWESSARAFAQYDVTDGTSWPYRKDVTSTRFGFRCGSPRTESACGVGLDCCAASVSSSAALPCSCVVRLACSIAHSCDTFFDAREVDRVVTMDTLLALVTNTFTSEATISAMTSVLHRNSTLSAGHERESHMSYPEVSGPIELCTQASKRDLLERAVARAIEELEFSRRDFEAKTRPFSRSFYMPYTYSSGVLSEAYANVGDTNQLCSGIVAAYAAARRCKSVAALRSDAGRFSQAWFIVPAFRASITETVSACAAMGCHTASQELATYVASWDSSLCNVACAPSLERAVAFVRTCDGASHCDVVWGIALAAAALGGSPEDIARAVRVGGPTAASAVALGGSRFGTCLQNHTNDDELTFAQFHMDMNAVCPCLGDDRDSYLFGAYSAMLADGVPTACIQVYPFVSTILLCTREDPRDEEYVTTLRRVAACPWSTLLVSTTAWLADALDIYAVHVNQKNRFGALKGFRPDVATPYRLPPASHVCDRIAKHVLRKGGVGVVLACCAWHIQQSIAPPERLLCVLRGLSALLRPHKELWLEVSQDLYATVVALDSVKSFVLHQWFRDYIFLCLQRESVYENVSEERALDMWSLLQQTAELALATLRFSVDMRGRYPSVVSNAETLILFVVKLVASISLPHDASGEGASTLPATASKCERRVPEALCQPIVPGALSTDAVRSKRERAAFAFADVAAIPCCADDRAWIEVPGHQSVPPLKALGLSLFALWNESDTVKSLGKCDGQCGKLTLSKVFNSVLSLLHDAENEMLYAAHPQGWFERTLPDGTRCGAVNADRPIALEEMLQDISKLGHLSRPDVIVAVRRCNGKTMLLSDTLPVADYPYSSPDACPYQCDSCGIATWPRPPSCPAGMNGRDDYDRTNRAWWEAFMLPKCSSLLGLIVSIRHGIPVIPISMYGHRKDDCGISACLGGDLNAESADSSANAVGTNSQTPLQISTAAELVNTAITLAGFMSSIQ